MTTQTATLMTADEFAGLKYDGQVELVRGMIVYSTMPKPIGTAISDFVRKHNLGEVYAAETGFVAGRDPDSVRAPDVAFVRAEIAATHNEDEWLPHSPDLAVEALSPTDRSEQVADKVQMWLSGGGRSVWVLDPNARSATVYQANGSFEEFSENDDLRDDSVLPGFTFRVRDAFDKTIAD